MFVQVKFSNFNSQGRTSPYGDLIRKRLGCYNADISLTLFLSGFELTCYKPRPFHVCCVQDGTCHNGIEKER